MDLPQSQSLSLLSLMAMHLNELREALKDGRKVTVGELENLMQLTDEITDAVELAESRQATQMGLYESLLEDARRTLPGANTGLQVTKYSDVQNVHIQRLAYAVDLLGRLTCGANTPENQQYAINFINFVNNGSRATYE